jgi:hypothetical protein
MKPRTYPIGDQRLNIRLQAQKEFVGFSQKHPPGVSEFFHPFKVVRGSSGPGYVAVISDSLLLGELVAGTDTGIAISSLGLNYNFSVSDGNYVYLKCAVTTLAVSSAEIWAGAEQNLITMSGSTQTYFHVPLARIRSAAGSNQPVGLRVGTNLWTQQRVFNHLRVHSFCVDGKPAIFALPC